MSATCERFLELFLSRAPITLEQQGLGGIPQDLACSRKHPKPRILFVALPDAAITLDRVAHSGVRPPAKPPAAIPSERERELVDQRAHFIGKSGDTLRVAEPHFEQRVVPDGHQPSHRLCQLMRARVRLLQASAPLLHQSEVKERDGEQPKQRDLRIGHERFSRRQVARLRKSESALTPGAGRVRSPLKLVHISVHDAGYDHKDRIIRC